MIKTILLGFTISVLIGVVYIFLKALISGMFVKTKHYGQNKETGVNIAAFYDGKNIKLNITNAGNEMIVINKIQLENDNYTQDIQFIASDKSVKIGEGRMLSFPQNDMTIDEDTNIVIYYNDTQDVVGIKKIKKENGVKKKEEQN